MAEKITATLLVSGETIINEINTQPRGPAGKSAYQSYLDTTDDDPVLTEEEWSAASGGVTDFAGLTDAATANLPVLNTPLATALSGKQPLDSDLTSWAGVTRASGFDTFTATPSSANLRALVTDETGTGALVFQDYPLFKLGFQIEEAGGTDTFGMRSAAADTWEMYGPDSGTVMSFSKAGTLTFSPSSFAYGTGAADAHLTALGGTAATGSGAIVRATSPTLTTPNIGAATGTSLATSGGVIAASLDVSGNVNVSTGFRIFLSGLPNLTMMTLGAGNGRQHVDYKESSFDIQKNGVVHLRVSSNGLENLTNLTASGTVKTGSTVFASLPAAATAGAGARHFITDCNTTTFLATAAGGGADAVPVVSDGTNWLVG